jgi:hypothetical protein
VIAFRIWRDNMPVIVTVGGAILLADSAQMAERVPPQWERIPFETLTVDDWLPPHPANDATQQIPAVP